MFYPAVSPLSTRWHGTELSLPVVRSTRHQSKACIRYPDAQRVGRVASQRAFCLAPDALASDTASATQTADDSTKVTTKDDRRRPQKVATGPTAVVQSAAAATSGPLPDALAGTFPSLYPTLSAARRTIRKGLVQVQGAVGDCKTEVQIGDELQVLELVRKHKAPRSVDLEVAYEDDVMAVVVKPWGVKLYSGDGRRTVTGALKAGALNPSSQPDALPEPKPVHRLDAAVGGLLVVAKTAAAASSLSTQFEQRTVHKVYHALLSGRLEPGVVAATAALTTETTAAVTAEDESEDDNQQQQQVPDQPELQLTDLLQLQLQGQPPFTITAADLQDSYLESATTATTAQNSSPSSSSSFSSSSSNLAPGMSSDVYVIDHPLEGKPCYTLYRVLGYSRCGRFGGWMTSVALSPVTGRKHQLRQHMALLGHPIVGDGKYTTNKEEHISNQGIYLESLEVHFSHPTTQERMTVRISEPQRFRRLREQQHRRWNKLAAQPLTADDTAPKDP